MHVEAFNGYPINRPLSSSVVLTCDASESGYGAHISFGGERRFCSGMWSFVERAKSSSFRELLAVDLALKSFQHFIIGKKVTIVSDIKSELCWYCTRWEQCHTLAVDCCRYF